jgi:hypothetical protein
MYFGSTPYVAICDRSALDQSTAPSSGASVLASLCTTCVRACARVNINGPAMRDGARREVWAWRTIRCVFLSIIGESKVAVPTGLCCGVILQHESCSWLGREASSSDALSGG